MDRPVPVGRVAFFDHPGPERELRRAVFHDPFGNEILPLLPVLPNSAATAPLLRLPTETLVNILSFVAVDRDSLRTLLRASRTCRQLALPWLFAVSRLYVHARSWPSCAIWMWKVRKGQAGPKGFVRHVHIALPGIDRLHFIAPLGRVALTSALPAMANLTSLTLGNKTPIDSSLLASIAGLPVRVLALNGSVFTEPVVCEPPSFPAVWPLKSLYLNIELSSSWRHPERDDRQLAHDLGLLYHGMIERCSPTLERLVVVGPELPDDAEPGAYPPVNFKMDRLRDLELHYQEPCRLKLPTNSDSWLFRLNSSLLSSLLSSTSLRNLSLISPSHTDFKLDPIRDKFLAIVKKSTHIHGLDLKDITLARLEREIPLLANSFSYLKSLTLGWRCSTQPSRWSQGSISDTSFALIGTIRTLEELRLGVVNWKTEFVDQHLWVVDHGLLQKAFGVAAGPEGPTRGLHRLRRLAFYNDVCHSWAVQEMVSDDYDSFAYYRLRFFNHTTVQDAQALTYRSDPPLPDLAKAQPSAQPVFIPSLAVFDDGPRDDEEAKRLERIEARIGYWERAHRNRLLCLAECYAACLPALELFYCGQVYMEIHAMRPSNRNQAEGLGYVVVPLNGEHEWVDKSLNEFGVHDYACLDDCECGRRPFGVNSGDFTPDRSL